MARPDFWDIIRTQKQRWWLCDIVKVLNWARIQSCILVETDKMISRFSEIISNNFTEIRRMHNREKWKHINRFFVIVLPITLLSLGCGAFYNIWTFHQSLWWVFWGKLDPFPFCLSGYYFTLSWLALNLLASRRCSKKHRKHSETNIDLWESF